MEMRLEVEPPLFERLERVRRAFEHAGVIDVRGPEDARRNDTLALVLELAGKRSSRTTPEAWARREKAREVIRLLREP